MFKIATPSYVTSTLGSPAFAFLRLLNTTPSDVHSLKVSSFMRRWLRKRDEENRIVEDRGISS